MPSVAPPPLRRLDEAGHHLAPAIVFDHPPPTGETTCLYQNGSDAPGAAGQDGSKLEASTVHHSARDATTVASSGIQAVLEVQVQSTFSKTKDLRREYLLDPGNGQRQPTMGRRADS